MREYVLITVAKAECDAFVASGQVRAEECAESFVIRANDQLDILLGLEDWPQIAAEAADQIF